MDLAATDIASIAQVEGRNVTVRDSDHAETINVASDESFIRSLDRLGIVSLESGLAGNPSHQERATNE